MPLLRHLLLEKLLLDPGGGVVGDVDVPAAVVRATESDPLASCSVSLRELPHRCTGLTSHIRVQHGSAAAAFVSLAAASDLNMVRSKFTT